MALISVFPAVVVISVLLAFVIVVALVIVATIAIVMAVITVLPAFVIVVIFLFTLVVVIALVVVATVLAFMTVIAVLSAFLRGDLRARSATSGNQHRHGDGGGDQPLDRVAPGRAGKGLRPSVELPSVHGRSSCALGRW
jgi:hypothetical protein